MTGAMTGILADREWRGRPWTSEIAGVATYSILVALFVLAWAYVPA